MRVQPPLSADHSCACEEPEPLEHNLPTSPSTSELPATR